MKRLLAIALGLLSSALIAQAPAICSAATPAIIATRSGTPVVHLKAANVVVTQPAGAGIVGLKPNPPDHLVLLLDISGSGNDDQSWPALAAMAEGFLRALPDSVAVRVASFNDKFRWDTDWRKPSSLTVPLAKALQGTHPKGGTAFNAAVTSAAADPQLASGYAVVVISDGDDDASQATGEQAAQDLQRLGVSFLLVEIGREHHAPYLGRFLEHAGALSYAVRGVPQPEVAAGLGRRLWNLLAAQVLLTVAGPRPGQVRLGLAPGLRHEGDALLYLQRPAACASANR